ncbi:MAG: hypothetical protein FWD25_08975 [Clostridia bacterium]|nr:hypothetical protein [Clostridia bacterium]
MDDGWDFYYCDVSGCDDWEDTETIDALGQGAPQGSHKGPWVSIGATEHICDACKVVAPHEWKPAEFFHAWPQFVHECMCGETANHTWGPTVNGVHECTEPGCAGRTYPCGLWDDQNDPDEPHKCQISSCNVTQVHIWKDDGNGNHYCEATLGGGGPCYFYENPQPHDWEWTNVDGGCQERECGYCDAFESRGHNFGWPWTGWSVTLPTCGDDGEMTRLCRNDGCEQDQTVVLPALGHWLSAAATCVDAQVCRRPRCEWVEEEALGQGAPQGSHKGPWVSIGADEHICDACDASFSHEWFPAWSGRDPAFAHECVCGETANHTWGPEDNGVHKCLEAGCAEAEISYPCGLWDDQNDPDEPHKCQISSCDVIQGHIWIDDGNGNHYCDITLGGLGKCHFYHNPQPHDWEWTNVDGGCQERECGYCDAFESRGHNFGWPWTGWSVTLPTCGDDGEMTRFCRNDGCEQDQTVVLPALGHWPGPAVTCLDDQVCRRWGCDEIILDAMGHDYDGYLDAIRYPNGGWIVRTPATQGQVGEEFRLCLNECGHEQPREIAKLPASLPTVTVVPAAVRRAPAGDTDTGVLGAFSRSDIVTDIVWGYLDAEYEIDELGDMNIFRVLAPPADDGSYVLRYLILTPALYAELTGDGYTHIAFEMEDAVLLVPFSSFAGLSEWPVTETTFVLMLDYQDGSFIAGAYALDGEVLDEEDLVDIFDELSGLTLTGGEKAE